MLNVKYLILVFIIICQLGCKNDNDKVVPLSGVWEKTQASVLPKIPGRYRPFMAGPGDTLFMG